MTAWLWHGSIVTLISRQCSTCTTRDGLVEPNFLLSLQITAEDLPSKNIRIKKENNKDFFIVYVYWRLWKSRITIFLYLLSILHGFKIRKQRLKYRKQGRPPFNARARQFDSINLYNSILSIGIDKINWSPYFDRRGSDARRARIFLLDANYTVNVYTRRAETRNYLRQHSAILVSRWNLLLAQKQTSYLTNTRCSCLLVVSTAHRLSHLPLMLLIYKLFN